MIVELLGQLSSIMGSKEIKFSIERKVKVKDILMMLPEDVKKNLFDEEYNLRPNLLILVNDTDLRLLGEDFEVSDEDKITVIPAFHGG